VPAPGEATSELYEDAGEGFTYRDGDYCYSRFHLVQTAERITITWERAGNFTPPYEHIELTLNGLRRAPRQVLADGVAYPVVMTDPVRRTALLGIPPFEKLEITYEARSRRQEEEPCILPPASSQRRLYACK
jgi:alpha-glucosidase